MSSLPPTPLIAASTATARSTFVTVLAWLSIVIAGAATFMSMMQAAVFWFLFRDRPSMPNHGWPGQDQLPVVLQFLFSHPEIFFVVFWSLSLLTLIASIGLLRRKNWARLYFIALLILGIVWEIGGLWVQHQMLAVAPSYMKDAPVDFPKAFEAFEMVISIGSIVFAIAVTVLCAWLLKRLLSRAVRAEFNAL
jgi:hypothetical protein